MQKINEEEYNSLLQNDKPILIDFSASWCQPCQQMERQLDEIESKYNQITFVKMDVDECQTISHKLGIKSIPTLVIIKNGEPSEYLIGAQSKGKIEAFLRS
jgi:thioredoxin 1